MRATISYLTTVALAAAAFSTTRALPVQDDTSLSNTKRTDAAAGFLSATFLGDVPHVYLHYSQADAPVTFSAVQGSQGVLVPTLGTGGARDPYIFQNQVNGKYYIMATDLDIAKTNWGDAQSHGSRSIHIWESTDGVNWSAERLVEMMNSTAGYVWAPSATWDSAANAYAVFWSSQTYAESDTDHTGAAEGPFVYYSHSTDMVNFSSPQRWESANFGGKVIDQEVLDLGNGNLYRWYSDVQGGTGVVMDKTTSGLFGTWERIGKPANVVWEGPAIQRDIVNPSKFYLWEDNYGGPGYSCFQTEDLNTIPFADCDPALTPTDAGSSSNRAGSTGDGGHVVDLLDGRYERVDTDGVETGNKGVHIRDVLEAFKHLVSARDLNGGLEHVLSAGSGEEVLDVLETVLVGVSNKLLAAVNALETLQTEFCAFDECGNVFADKGADELDQAGDLLDKLDQGDGDFDMDGNNCLEQLLGTLDRLDGDKEPTVEEHLDDVELNLNCELSLAQQVDESVSTDLDDVVKVAKDAKQSVKRSVRYRRSCSRTACFEAQDGVGDQSTALSCNRGKVRSGNFESRGALVLNDVVRLDRADGSGIGSPNSGKGDEERGSDTHCVEIESVETESLEKLWRWSLSGACMEQRESCSMRR
ncbi:arabinosidase [Pseudozyma hubeiensis SY62]|uniref:Arabinosidase n=1 Tax=Pseudozyma hubeiensis (strain SY62) TaxID=1305764 RepID=R9PJJ5_PSEHS|nr:arabinosidase [Pseudozyma hubeiensis SY62]GAC98275.1 arabinosidase [Pseudozyma hubeiensis SY62]